MPTPTTYNYTKMGVDVRTLHKEIGADPGILVALDGTKYSPISGNLDIVMVDVLPGAEETALNDVVTNHVGPDAVIPTVESITMTGDTTTVNPADELVSGMTITPLAGTYLAFFSGSVDHSSSNASLEMSIYVDGSQANGSERRVQRGAGQGNVTADFTCLGVVTVNGSQAVEGRWRTPSSTGTMHERSLILLKVA